MSLLLALLIWQQWPLAGTSAVGILVGVNLVGTGIALLAFAGSIKNTLRKAIFVLPKQNCGSQSGSAWKVSQLATCPDLKPVMNQRARCSDDPCVKASGTT